MKTFYIILMIIAINGCSIAPNCGMKKCPLQEKDLSWLPIYQKGDSLFYEGGAFKDTLIMGKTKKYWDVPIPILGETLQHQFAEYSLKKNKDEHRDYYLKMRIHNNMWRESDSSKLVINIFFETQNGTNVFTLSESEISKHLVSDLQITQKFGESYTVINDNDDISDLRYIIWSKKYGLIEYQIGSGEIVKLVLPIEN